MILVEIFEMVGDAVGKGAGVDAGAVVFGIAAEDSGVVGRGEDGFAERLADFAGVDVEGAGEADVADLEAGDVGVHEAGVIFRVAAVMGDALHERAGAIAHADHGRANFIACGHKQPRQLPRCLSPKLLGYLIY